MNKVIDSKATATLDPKGRHFEFCLSFLCVIPVHSIELTILNSFQQTETISTQKVDPNLDAASVWVEFALRSTT